MNMLARLSVILFLCMHLDAQPAFVEGVYTAERFSKSEVMIPMRDGVKLHTTVFTPNDHMGSLPILFFRSPYGIHGTITSLEATLGALMADGYIFAFQDIRGRLKSEGQFVMQRPPRDRNDSKATDESTDAYDSIDWMIRNTPRNNGRVGMLGVSYDAWLVTMALLDPHPALRAASEQATPADMFLGDDFHHNGAFRLSYGFEYAALLESDKTANTNFSFDRADTYQWYLDLGVLSNANTRYFRGAIPTWNDFVAHPNYDEFWQKQAFAKYIKAPPKVPILHVAGWWDQEDFYGPVKVYELFEKGDAKQLNYFVAGPWNHGGWRFPDGSRLGEITFDSNTSKYFREQIEAPWFAWWLHNRGNGHFAEATVFRTGSNRWEHYDRWPPPATRPTSLYLRSGGQMSFKPPTSDESGTFDSYVSDPARPIPYRQRPISPTYPDGGWPTWLVEDQRFVDNRPDVLTWQTETLKDTIVVAGDIVARIFASTTGTDADWIVKLIDVYPEKFPENPKLAGYQLMIAAEILRGRFRNSFEHPTAITPGHVTRYDIDLQINDHAFLKGHRIMVQIQSTWFPLYDANPQTFVENIFNARASDYQRATQRVFRSPDAASHILLPVVH
jgi:putative CocE/NonD family hydrolase